MMDPTNPYSAAKAGAEMMCKAYQTRCGARSAAPRMQGGPAGSMPGCSRSVLTRSSSHLPMPPLQL